MAEYNIKPCPSYFFVPFISRTESTASSGSVHGAENSHFSSVNRHHFDRTEGRRCKFGSLFPVFWKKGDSVMIAV